MKKKVKVLVVCDPMDCSPPQASVYGTLQEEYWSGLPFPSPGELLGMAKDWQQPKCPSVGDYLYVIVSVYLQKHRKILID